MKSVLFLCVENSNRSQMAEAFAKIHGSPELKAYSAGSRPSGKVNPRAIAAMAEIGYDLTAHTSKGVEGALGPMGTGGAGGIKEELDYVVTMGCGDDCPTLKARHRLEWEIPDPREMPEEEFRKVRDLIEQKVKGLIEALTSRP